MRKNIVCLPKKIGGTQMKKIRILSLILAFLFIFAALASCNNKQEDETTQGTTAGAETTQPSETT